MLNSFKETKPIAYTWECLACRSGNPKESTSCSTCGCPATPTVDEIKRFRPGYAQDVDAALRQKKISQDATKKALERSHYRYWYWGSLLAYILSLAFPKAAGLYMLAFGLIAIEYSLAWFANPLLIFAFILANPKNDPGSWRCLAYCSLALMFAQPIDNIIDLLQFPFLTWLTSAVLLAVGIERYRAQYGKAMSEES